MANLTQWLKQTSVKRAILIFIIVRLFLVFWSTVSLTINPLPEDRDEAIRPYLGELVLDKGVSGLLLGPWQRFDSQRYLVIAREGYANEQNSVFPPLYPLVIRVLGGLLGGGSAANLMVAIFIANLACLGYLILLHRVVTHDIDEQVATRTLIYLVLFPTGFFLFAPYTEPIFMLLALGSLWAGRNGRFWLAGSLGFLAALTRLTGWILVVPLAYEVWQQEGEGRGERGEEGKEKREGGRGKGEEGLFASSLSLLVSFLPTLLPPLGLVTFIVWRWYVGLPPLSQIYQQYWYQTTNLPGSDIVRAIDTLFFNGPARANEFISLALDFAVTIFLFVTTAFVWRRLPRTYGLYSVMLLLFILLPTSELKPIYSFSRYALAFFPTFILLGIVGERPSINRLILYPFLLLYLYFSGQFFVWGWVA